MTRIVKTSVATAAALTAVALLSACKGRTSENVQPSGETIEVIIDQPTQMTHQLSDMPPAPADSSITDNSIMQ